MLYLVPETGSLEEVIASTTRAQIPFHNPKTIRDLILVTHAEPLCVAAVSEEIMLLLSRFASSVFPDELPLVLMSVPGVLYQPGWASMATAFPPAHFRDFTEATKRSGVLSPTAEILESRGKGALVAPVTTASSMSEDYQPSEPADGDDEAEY